MPRTFDSFARVGPPVKALIWTRKKRGALDDPHGKPDGTEATETKGDNDGLLCHTGFFGDIGWWLLRFKMGDEPCERTT